MTDLPPPTSRPGLPDVMERLSALRIVVGLALKQLPVHAMVLDALAHYAPEDAAPVRAAERAAIEDSRTRLQTARYWPLLTRAEQAFHDTPLSELAPAQLTAMMFRTEAAAVLLWAVGLRDALPPRDAWSDPAWMEVLAEPDLRARVALRSPTELAAARQDAEMWLWRARTEGLIRAGTPVPAEAGAVSFEAIVHASTAHAVEHGLLPTSIAQDFPVFGKAYRTVTQEEWSQLMITGEERLWALNWLCGRAQANDWEQTPRGT